METGTEWESFSPQISIPYDSKLLPADTRVNSSDGSTRPSTAIRLEYTSGIEQEIQISE